jgi:hypothetical protein
MRTIFKYPLEVADNQVVRMPAGATILTVQTQWGAPCIWAIVDDAQPNVNRKLLVVGTGHKLPLDCGQYVGTFQVEVGSADLVFHVFDLGEVG